MQTVSDNKVVTMHYTLRDDAGETIDSSQGHEPLEYLHGAGNIVPGLEKALAGRAVGDKLTVRVEAAEGYGERDERGVQRVARKQLPPDMPLKPGIQLGARGPDGQMVPVWLKAVEGDQVVLDFNHPLAGATLHFEVELVGLREATLEELSHGHAHGAHGHHH